MQKKVYTPPQMQTVVMLTEGVIAGSGDNKPPQKGDFSGINDTPPTEEDLYGSRKADASSSFWDE